MMAKSARFFTVGCKVNQYETQAIRETFLQNGYTESGNSEQADIFVINTCTVTEKADRDSRRLIHLAHRLNALAKIVVTGCLVEKDAKDVSLIEGVTHVIKNSAKHMIPQLLSTEALASAPESPIHYTPLEISDFRGHTRAFIKIQDGCDNFCSFCKVPFVRGRSRSRDLEHIVGEARRLIEKGFKELVLCGICLGEWGRDLQGGLKLADLLDKIETIDGEYRIRLSSIEPKLVSEHLIKKIADSPKICNHLHIPLQSGDDKILKRMNRPYSAKDYIKLIQRIKKLIPGFSLSTDMLVGFPGEDEKRFRNSLNTLKHINPSRTHIFSYSRRKGTASYGYKPDISNDEKKRRAGLLLDLAEGLAFEYRKKFLGKALTVLIENRRDKNTQLLTGYTDTYIKLFVDGPDSLYGQFTSVMPLKIDRKSTFCVPIT